MATSKTAKPAVKATKPAPKTTAKAATATAKPATKAVAKPAAPAAKPAAPAKAAPVKNVNNGSSSFQPYVAKKGEEYMSKGQLAHFANILGSLKNDLMSDIERTVHTMQDEQTVFADPNDRASQERDDRRNCGVDRVGQVFVVDVELNLEVSLENIFGAQLLRNLARSLGGEAFFFVELGQFGELLFGKHLELTLLFIDPCKLAVALTADRNVFAEPHRNGSGRETRGGRSVPGGLPRCRRQGL